MSEPEITEVVNAQMPLGATLGIRTFGDVEEVEASLDWAPSPCTAGGVLHGGVLMALLRGSRVRVPQRSGGRSYGHDRVEDELLRRGSGRRGESAFAAAAPR